MKTDPPAISTTEGDEIIVRGFRLADELIGKLTFTEMFLLDLDGRKPSSQRVRVVDAVLVALMEHGITPSTLAARLVLDGAPEAMQGAMAAGVLATGSRFLGTIEQVAGLLQAIAAHTPERVEEATAEHVAAILAAHGRVPGLGHNLHDKVDPRVRVLQQVAAEEDSAGRHAAALSVLQRVAAEQVGRPLIVNAAGAVGAILSDLGYPARQVRGFALVARSAGVVAHLADEQERPIARGVWMAVHDRHSRRIGFQHASPRTGEAHAVIESHQSIPGLAPATGPFSLVTVAPATAIAHVSGQIGVDERHQIVGPGDAYAQATKCLENVDLALRHVGATRQEVIKVTVFLVDIADRAAVATARAEYFGDHRPAATLVEVSALAHPECLVEIEAVALVPQMTSVNRRK